MKTSGFNTDHYRWLEYTEEDSSSYKVRYEQHVLGYDRGASTFVMILRFRGDGGHCVRHRHITTTTVLVLEGEQHLTDLLPGGETRQKMRRAGEYHLTTGDVHPHMERGGDEGALIFYSHHTPDGRMYELLDDDLEVIHVVTMEEMIESWENGD